MSVAETIRTKRAVRLFADTTLPEEAVRAILNAGRRAQSSKNTQPWEFVAIRDKATLKRLSECGQYAGHLAGAALGVALVAPEGDDASRREWILFDLGQAAAQMQLAAWELGIGSCIASIYEPDQARTVLGFPADRRCDVAISFGYPQPRPERPQVIRADGRKAFDEVVHWDRW